MLKIDNFEVVGWEHAIRGMRNPKNSWDKSDSEQKFESPHDLYGGYIDIGPNDHKLMVNLAYGGPVHAKYRRMITVYVDITAPLYWWKEFDTYKVGTVANSCSTMHKIHDKEFTLDDFSHEHLFDRDAEWENTFDLINDQGVDSACCPTEFMKMTCGILNFYRQRFLETNDKKYWWQMIQLLPSSYNQKRTIMLNYEVLVGIYKWRRNHKLDEWHTFCDWIEELPYSELITGYKEEETNV